MSQKPDTPGPGGDLAAGPRIRSGAMRDEILAMVVEALNRQGYPGLTLESVRNDPAHREAFLDMLGDCRPLPVVRALMEDARQGRL